MGAYVCVAAMCIVHIRQINRSRAAQFHCALHAYESSLFLCVCAYVSVIVYYLTTRPWNTHISATLSLPQLQ